MCGRRSHLAPFATTACSTIRRQPRRANRWRAWWPCQPCDAPHACTNKSGTPPTIYSPDILWASSSLTTSTSCQDDGGGRGRNPSSSAHRPDPKIKAAHPSAWARMDRSCRPGRGPFRPPRPARRRPPKLTPLLQQTELCLTTPCGRRAIASRPAGRARISVDRRRGGLNFSQTAAQERECARRTHAGKHTRMQTHEHTTHRPHKHNTNGHAQ